MNPSTFAQYILKDILSELKNITIEFRFYVGESDIVNFYPAIKILKFNGIESLELYRDYFDTISENSIIQLKKLLKESPKYSTAHFIDACIQIVINLKGNINNVLVNNINSKIIDLNKTKINFKCVERSEDLYIMGFHDSLKNEYSTVQSLSEEYFQLIKNHLEKTSIELDFIKADIVFNSVASDKHDVNKQQRRILNNSSNSLDISIDQKRKWQNELSKSNIREVLDEMSKIVLDSKNEKYKIIIINISSKFNRLEDDKIQGIINYDEQNHEFNRINFQIMEFLNKIETA